MADVAQLVRALVCGTRCREFESHLSPHIQKGSFSRTFSYLTILYFPVDPNPPAERMVSDKSSTQSKTG